MRTLLVSTTLLVVLLAVCGGQALAATTVTLFPVAAASIFTPKAAGGVEVVTSSLPVGYNTDNVLYRGLLRFDLSGIPAGATITKAKLLVYHVGTDGVDLPVQVYRYTKAWDPATLTWAGNASSFNSTVLASAGGGASTGTWVNFSVLSLAKSWLVTPAKNFGLMLRGSSEGGDYSFHRYATGGNQLRPRLQIEYTP
jgi:hypothetical protein